MEPFSPEHSHGFKVPATPTRGPRVPPKWQDAGRMGQPVFRMIPFKAPMDSRYDSVLGEEFRFTPDMFLETQKSRGREIGLIVDVSGCPASTYYEKGDFTKHGMAVAHIPRGDNDVPQPAELTMFNHIVKRFLDMNAENQKMIGVHCTFGFNRAGYFICAYLVDVMDWSLDAALAAFAKSRPPGIYAQAYLRPLYEHCDEPIPTTLPTPPQWDQTAPPSPKPGTPTKTHHFPAISYPHLNLTKSVPVAESSKLNQIISDLLSGPRVNPAWLSQTSSAVLDKHRFMVTWKPAGTRFWMLILGPNVYMVDRLNTIFPVAMHFPLRGHPGKLLDRTLIDGELVIDRDGRNTLVRYLAFDLIAFQGQPQRSNTFVNRLKILQREIIGARKADTTHDFSREPVHIRVKDYFPLKDTNRIVGPFAKSLPHMFDGLVFIAEDSTSDAVHGLPILRWVPNKARFRVTAFGETPLVTLGTSPRGLSVKELVNDAPSSGSVSTDSAIAKDDSSTPPLSLHASADEGGYAAISEPFQGVPSDTIGRSVECEWRDGAWVYLRTFDAFVNISSSTTVAFISSPAYLEENAMKDLVASSLSAPVYNTEAPAQQPKPMDTSV